MPIPSTIQILVNDTFDITRYVVFAQSNFNLVASGMPGQAHIVLKDPNKELDFSTGDEITLIIDGIKLWGGLLFDKGEGHFFPVVDTTDLDKVHDLQWTLTATDYNIWMDKRIIRYAADYLHQKTVGPGYFGKVMREEAIPNFMDVPPGLDYTTYVEDTDYYWCAPDLKDKDGNWVYHYGDPAPLMQQGTKWRDQMDEVTKFAGYTWYIDADKYLHLHPYRVLVSPWSFVDRNPDGVTRIGFREGTIREDGMQMITDALVWGGRVVNLEFSTVDDHPVFARYPDLPSETEVIMKGSQDMPRGITMPKWREDLAFQRIIDYGRWQRAEVRFNDPLADSQDAVKFRAYSIVAGPNTGTREDGIDTGLNRPVWQVSLSWFAHDVPERQHLIPGHFATMVFSTMEIDGNTPGTLLLPLLSLAISFPTLPPELPGGDPLTYVRFDGQFGINYSDSRYMWRFLMNSRSQTPQTVVATVGQDSSSSIAGAMGSFYPLEQPDGSRKQFTLPHTYLAGTTEVYINGLLQRPRFEYLESAPDQGIISFVVAPFADDTIWVTCRTGAG